MREARKTQSSLRETWLEVDHARELQAMSRVLDDNPMIAELVWQDLGGASGSKQTTRGAGGMSGEQVLRVLVVKQMNGFSYRELAFHLADSRSYQTFCQLGITDNVPTKSALNANLKALQPATLEAINRVLLEAALKEKVETGRTVRTDCTVVQPSPFVAEHGGHERVFRTHDLAHHRERGVVELLDAFGRKPWRARASGSCARACRRTIGASPSPRAFSAPR